MRAEKPGALSELRSVLAAQRTPLQHACLWKSPALSGILLVLVGILCWSVSNSVGAPDANAEDAAYRRDRLAWMRSDKSPLALSGLFWLKPGTNTFGTQPDSDIVLPSGSGPARAGSFELSGKAVTVRIESDVAASLDGKQVRSQELRSDGPSPHVLHLNNLRLRIIERDGRMAVRLARLDNPLLLRFERLDFFEIDPGYRVVGKFLPHQPPKKIKVATILGYADELDCPGIVQFTLNGKQLQLEPVYETAGDSRLYFMFKDATNGKETYGGGRYLYSSLPKDGQVLLNFNQAHNPYCAYNEYSTCQIPPLQNWLKSPIRAGEKKYGGGK